MGSQVSHVGNHLMKSCPVRVSPNVTKPQVGVNSPFNRVMQSSCGGQGALHSQSFESPHCFLQPCDPLLLSELAESEDDELLGSDANECFDEESEEKEGG